MELFEIVLAVFTGFWFFLPAYAANPTAVLFGGGRPVDGGRVCRDGRRMLGDGKTWPGTFGGIMCGIMLGLLASAIAWGFSIESLQFGEPLAALWACILLATGSMAGDMLGSFIKRRGGRARGAKTPILDQYDFVIGGILFLLVGYPSWLFENYWEGTGWLSLLTIIILTPILHRAVNIAGYKMGKKDVPW